MARVTRHPDQGREDDLQHRQAADGLMPAEVNTLLLHLLNLLRLWRICCRTSRAFWLGTSSSK